MSTRARPDSALRPSRYGPSVPRRSFLLALVSVGAGVAVVGCGEAGPSAVEPENKDSKAKRFAELKAKSASSTKKAK